MIAVEVGGSYPKSARTAAEKALRPEGFISYTQQDGDGGVGVGVKTRGHQIRDAIVMHIGDVVSAVPSNIRRALACPAFPVPWYVWVVEWKKKGG